MEQGEKTDFDAHRIRPTTTNLLTLVVGTIHAKFDRMKTYPHQKVSQQSFICLPCLESTSYNGCLEGYLTD